MSEYGGRSGRLETVRKKGGSGEREIGDGTGERQMRENGNG